MAARIQLPSKLIFDEWECIVDTSEDNANVEFLRFGFPAGYTGPVPTPKSGNHPLANCHLQDLVVYIVKELGHGAMLGPFLTPRFQPWCQINPLLTRPTKDSRNRRFIMDLSWPHPPRVSINRNILKDTYLGNLT